jgi:hypothetical protein
MANETGVVFYPSKGEPSLLKALSRDHAREWIKHISQDAHPEQLDEETDRLWTMFQGIHQDDYLIVQHNDAQFSLAEVTGPYQFEAGDPCGRHQWPVRWVAKALSFDGFSGLKPFIGVRRMQEVPASEARILFLKYLPSLSTKSYVLFRWVSIGLLISELVYFWPR